jgi:hypothetical protein
MHFVRILAAAGFLVSGVVIVAADAAMDVLSSGRCAVVPAAHVI